MEIVYTFAIKNFTIQQGYEELRVDNNGELHLEDNPTPAKMALIEQFGGKLKAEEKPLDTRKFDESPPKKSKTQEAD